MWASWRGTCCTISLNQPLCHFHYSAQSHMAEARRYLCAAPFHGTAGSGGKHSHVFVHVHILKAMDVAPMATELKSALLQPCDSRLIEWVKSLSQPPYRGRDEKYKTSWLLGVRCPALLQQVIYELMVLSFVINGVSELGVLEGRASLYPSWSIRMCCWTAVSSREQN